MSRKSIKSVDEQIEKLMRQRKALRDKLALQIGKKLMKDFDIESVEEYESFKRERVKNDEDDFTSTRDNDKLSNVDDANDKQGLQSHKRF